MTRALQLLTVAGLGALGGLVSSAVILAVVSPWDRVASADQDQVPLLPAASADLARARAAPAGPGAAAPQPSDQPMSRHPATADQSAGADAEAADASSWGWLTFSGFGFSDTAAAPDPIAAADRLHPPEVAACDRLDTDAGGRILVGSGDCFVRAGGTQVTAAKIRLDLADDAVTARGDVRWIDMAGDRRQAEAVRLNGPVRAIVVDTFRAQADAKPQISADRLLADRIPAGTMPAAPAGDARPAAPLPATAGGSVTVPGPVHCAGIVEENGRLVGRHCTADIAGTGLRAGRFEFDPVDGALIALGDVAWWQDGGPPTPAGAARIEAPLRASVIDYLSRGPGTAGDVAAVPAGP